MWMGGIGVQGTKPLTLLGAVTSTPHTEVLKRAMARTDSPINPENMEHGKLREELPNWPVCLPVRLSHMIVF